MKHKLSNINTELRVADCEFCGPNRYLKFQDGRWYCNYREFQFKVMHKLTEIDPETRTAECSVCGPVTVYKNGAKVTPWMCTVVKTSTDNNPIYEHRLRSEREIMREAHGPCCDICGRDDEKLVYDHNHDTGKFRGWLCPEHNLGLGKFQDNPEHLRAAAAYLENVSKIMADS
jgi:hypothetical protein